MEKKRGRPPKKAYAGNCLTQELLETMSAVYAEKQELKATTLVLELPPHKVKKLLITHGDIHYAETDQIIEMQQRGMSISEIAKRMGMSPKTVNTYLPYSKVVYKLDDISQNAERVKNYQQRKKATERLRTEILKASCAIPFVCKPYEVKNVPYYDGALGDPVPVEKAFQLGCDQVVVILTKPEGELRTAGKDEKMAARIRKKYPKAAEKLCQRAQRYNEGVSAAQKFVRQGKALILSPDETCGVSTLKKDRTSPQRLYDKGYADGKKISDFLPAL